MAKDPYRYFRIEARDLVDGLEKAALRLEQGEHDAELFALMLRQAHTLKGAARVVRLERLGERAHALESVLEPYRAGGRALEAADVARLFEQLDQLSAGIRAIDAPVATAAVASPAAAEGSLDSIRVEIRAIDEVLEHAHAALRQTASFERSLAAVQQAEHALGLMVRKGYDPDRARDLGRALALCRRSIGESAAALERDIDALRAGAATLRLCAAESIFGALERTVSDAVRSAGREVEWRAEGGDTKLDAHALAAARTALLHVVRNAVVHGIEDPAVREAAGKPRRGAVTLSVRRQGDRVSFLCQDDGAGIDLVAVEGAAKRSGKLAEDATLTMADAARLLLRGGVTTTKALDQLSGRGVGMSVLAEEIRRLGGDIEIDSTPGRGTGVRFALPVSLSSTPSLTAHVADHVVSLSLDAIERLVRLAEGSVHQTASGQSLVVDGEALPFAPLGELLDPQNPPGRSAAAVVLRATRGRRVALGVERIGDVEHTVVRALPALAPVDPVVAGASIDAGGRPRLVLDPAAVAERVALGVKARRAPDKPRLDPVLVVDDSLTTRMLEQSILESAGYPVELCSSGEEALELALSRRFSLFVVDIEMPGMNGFELIDATRADPALRHVPAILVTSLADADHKRRGLAAGASAYIVKGEFDQRELLATIRRLIGEP